jgi:hypothetical protein
MTQIEPETTAHFEASHAVSDKRTYANPCCRSRWCGRPMNRMSQIEPETAMLGNLHLRFANMDLRVETIASPPRGNISTKKCQYLATATKFTRRRCRTVRLTHQVGLVIDFNNESG